MNWLLSPAFTDETSRATVWIMLFRVGFDRCSLGSALSYQLCVTIQRDPRRIAIADAKVKRRRYGN